MQIWLQNAETSVYVGIALFVVMLVPGLIWQYVKYGGLSARRIIGWLAVCVYGAALMVYTFMPLPPDGAAWCAEHTVRANRVPFAFLDDIRRETTGLGIAQTLRSTVVLQVVFNVVLFVPFGMILRRYFGRGVLFSTTTGFLTSLLIETLQYTGLLGVYPCAIRVADVDDLMMNTLGALLGAVLAPALLWWMPSSKQLADKRLHPRKVTAWRRWLGMAIDATLFAIVSSGITVAFSIVRYITGADVATEPPAWHATVGAIAAILLVFVLPAAGGRGASAGQKIVWLTPKWLSKDGSRLTDANPLLRICRALVVIGPWFITDLLPDAATSAGVVGLLSTLILFLTIVMVPFTRTHRSFSGWVTRAVFVDSRDPFAGGPNNEEAPVLTGAKKRELKL